MGVIDATVIESLSKAVESSVQELNTFAGTEKENVCWVKTNFLKHFTEDVFFLNDHSEDDTFLRRYGNLVIRNMLEQLIEFLYLKKTDRYEEYLGLTINFEHLNRKKSIVKKEELFGGGRYNRDPNGRPPISEMAKSIGEKSSSNGNLTLYKLYQILSERCHSSYFTSLIDDVSKVHFSVPVGGLNETQLRDVHIMALIVLEEYNVDI